MEPFGERSQSQDRAPNPPGEIGESDGGPSLNHLVVVVWPAYGVLGFSVFVSWDLRSQPALISAAALAAALGGVMGGVGVLKAKSRWGNFEARTSKSVPSKRRKEEHQRPGSRLLPTSSAGATNHKSKGERNSKRVKLADR